MDYLDSRRKDFTEKEYLFNNKTIIIKIRVSDEEKKYIKMLAKLNQGDNVSNFIRKLIFEVYYYDITNKSETIIKSILSNKPYPFNTIRTEFICIRLTSKEKSKIEFYAKMNNRDISEFVRWVVLNLYLNDYILEL